MIIKTAQTINEIVRSFNPDTNIPVFPATFTNIVFKDGIIDTGTTVVMTITDISNGIYRATWSASSVGFYQLHIDNDDTDVQYISDMYQAKTDSEVDGSTTVYVGL